MSTNSADALQFESDKDVAARWKIAFGVCVAIIVILMAGKLQQFCFLSREYAGR